MRRPRVRFTVRWIMRTTAVVALYLAIYCALVYRDLFHDSPSHRDQVVECYGAWPRFCAVVFDPANRLDRAIRRSYWSTPSSVY